MDEMAMQLAQKTSAADAWSTIFRTGNSGGWGSTRVAIKVNGINGDIPTKDTINRPRVAVVKKICDVLVDQFNVQPANITLYDATSDASTCYTTSVSLTDSTKIRANVSKLGQSLGGMVPVTIVAATKTMTCVGDLVNGVTDILVNISVLKAHLGPSSAVHPLFGTCSLCMKNHFGTFVNSGAASATGLHTLEALLEINKHPAVLGGSPVRQQLCIVDCLMANSSGAGGNADARVDRLVMGTFAPIVDYLTATNVLFNSTAMGVPAVSDFLNNHTQFLTSFGYAATDPLQWIELGAGGTSTGTGGAGGGGTGASGGAGSGGTSAAGGAGSGGTSAAGGAGSGGTKGSGGVGSGGTKGSGGAGGTSGSGGAGSGGTSAAGGAGSGGATAAGGTTGSGGNASGGTGGTGGAATSSASASGGSTTTGGTHAGTGTGASATGGSSGTGNSTAKGANSESGCDVAGVDRRATRWGAMLAFGAVVAEKLRRLVSGSDRSS
jgi:hypothetical protein